MNIKREDNFLIMTERIVCGNYGDMKHQGLGFEKLNEYYYKCKSCGNIISIKRSPIIIMDDKGGLKVQVVVENEIGVD
jgi:hypothetical protein